MKLAVIAFSPRGMRLGRRIGGIAGLETSYYAPRRHAAGTDCEAFDSIYALCARLFAEREALVFVGAAGIAVRAIAPWVKSKLADPAVVVCDETGRFAISLLSGHAGGANQLTEQIAAAIGAQPVITTASDCHAALSDEAQPRNLILGIGCRRASRRRRSSGQQPSSYGIRVSRLRACAKSRPLTSSEARRACSALRRRIGCPCAFLQRSSWRVCPETFPLPSGCFGSRGWTMSASGRQFSAENRAD